MKDAASTQPAPTTTLLDVEALPVINMGSLGNAEFTQTLLDSPSPGHNGLPPRSRSRSCARAQAIECMPIMQPMLVDVPASDARGSPQAIDFAPTLLLVDSLGPGSPHPPHPSTTRSRGPALESAGQEVMSSGIEFLPVATLVAPDYRGSPQIDFAPARVHRPGPGSPHSRKTTGSAASQHPAAAIDIPLARASSRPDNDMALALVPDDTCPLLRELLADRPEPSSANSGQAGDSESE